MSTQLKRLRNAVVKAGLLMVFCGCAQIDSTPRRIDQSLARDTIPLMPGEQIDVGPSHREMPVTRYLHTIDANGNISLPLIGDIHVAGLSPEAACERIQNEYVPHFFLRLEIHVSRLTPDAKGARSLERHEH